jgi:hypothetical protein
LAYIGKIWMRIFLYLHCWNNKSSPGFSIYVHLATCILHPAHFTLRPVTFLSLSLLYLIDRLSHTPTQTHQFTNSPIHQFTNSPIHQFTNSPIHQFANSPIHQFTNSPIRQFTNSPIHQFTSSPIHQFTNSPIHQFTNSPIHQFTNSPVHQFTNSPIHQLLAPAGPQTQPAREYLLRKYFTNSLFFLI